LKLAAVSLSDRMFQFWRPHRLHPAQQDLFQSELTRIERNRSSSQILTVAQHYLHSSENLFISHVLSGIYGSLKELHDRHTNELKIALKRSPEILADAAVLWKATVRELFTVRNRPVPDWPHYIEIQEGLGIYGSTRFHRFIRSLKKKAQERLKSIFERLSFRFPKWKWAVRTYCYLTAALWHRYRLPSGGFSC
jgi:hypothetical protein